MPSLSVAVPHKLGQELALERLKERSRAILQTYQEHIRNLEEQWNGGSGRYRFSAMGMQIKGTVTADASQVKVDVDLPFVALIFRGTIEEQVRKELGTILA